MSETETKGQRVIYVLAAVWLGLWALAVVLTLVAIWTTDERWGHTAVVAFVVGTFLFAWALIGQSVEEDKAKKARSQPQGER